MSANSESFISCRITVQHDLDDARAFSDVLTHLAAPLGLDPGRMVLHQKARTYARATFAAHLEAPTSEDVVLWGREADTTAALVYLRDGADLGGDNTDRGIAFAVPAASLEAVRELLSAIHRHFDIVSANIAGYPDARRAQKEGIRRGLSFTVEEEFEERVRWDAMWWRRARTKLIRLSPITVVGPSLWATWPPMPTFDPAPIVEDLPGASGCKIITAWPTLCGPRDPDFLHGTRALRAWLWPYTIQNPADDPANDVT